MKTLRRAISAALSAAIAGTVLAANSASFCFTASAMTDTRFFAQFQFESSWYSLIQQEKQKFPETVNGQYQVLDGSWQTYQPKKGDSVRLDHEHSIFITNVFSSGITFAQCNANNQCEIDWDATKYKGQTVTAAYLRQHATYVERPVLAGDLNLDGTIDSADAAIFADTMMTNGSRIGTAPDSTLDANSDLRIDEQDYICRTRLRSEDSGSPDC
ncbi:MAG: hypothetical protein IJL32_04825 [Oscillospiraceae bacterium]|nr:hypothetical protein [Oscillospiraceae bacterium]